MHDWVSNNKNPWKDKRVWSPFVTMAACYPGMQAWHSLPAAEAGGHSQHSASYRGRAAALEITCD